MLMMLMMMMVFSAPVLVREQSLDGSWGSTWQVAVWEMMKSFPHVNTNSDGVIGFNGVTNFWPMAWLFVIAWFKSEQKSATGL